MNKRIICTVIIIIVLILSVYTIYYRNYVHRTISIFEACSEKCDSINDNAEKKYQECLALQMECDGFECLPNDTPRVCKERKVVVCRPVLVCWERYYAIKREQKVCQIDCNKLVSILGQ